MALSNRKEKIGQVVSNKMDKTVVVKIERLVKHPVYEKYVKRTTKIKAHDNENKCQIGDTVKIREARPISRDKKWRVVEIFPSGHEEI
jgi:small subunit ribosomal protein S17